MKKIFSVLLVAIMLACSVVPAMALPSPSATESHDVNITPPKGGSTDYKYEHDEDGNEYVTITAHPKKGYKFKYWIIDPDGAYEIVEGDLESPVVKLLLLGDIDATPIFEKIGSNSSSKPEPTKPSPSKNNSNKSPQTGADTTYYLFWALGLFAIAAGSVGVKLACSRK